MLPEVLRETVEAHAAAVVDPIDVAHIQADLIEELHPMIPAIAELLPQPVTQAEVTAVSVDGAQGRVTIAYSGEGKRVVIDSVWEQRGDRPQMVQAIPPTES